MMLIKSIRFGEREVEESKIILMPGGMLGFSEEKRYVLLTPPQPGPFLWLQAVDNPHLAFVVVHAKKSFPGCAFALTAEEFSSLGLVDAQSEVIFLLVVTLAPNPRDITVNLHGPILLNPDRMLARQIVLDGANYSSRQPFFASPSPDEEASSTPKF
jgi:flagellar assembly factor FliW